MTFAFCAPPLLIMDDAALATAAEQWLECTVVALDTEFMRTDTFFPKLALIQLCDGRSTWLIDPLPLTNLAPLIALLTNPKILKVLHSCSEDLEVLQHFMGCSPAPLFDTQVAAALTGHGFSRGYSALVKDLSGVELSKQETRSDWLKRPLSKAQLDYAALDVHYLLPMYEQLTEALRERGRLHWMDEEMATLEANAAAPQLVQNYYQRIKGAWRLDRRGVGVLQQLGAWREGEARLRNRPRNWVVADKILLEIAAVRPTTYGALAALEVVGQKILDRYGGLMIDIVAAVLQQSENALPETLPKSLPRESGAFLNKCRERVQTVAAELGLAPEMLARKVDMEQLVRTHRAGAATLPPPLNTGWRRTVIGDQLLSCVQVGGE